MMSSVSIRGLQPRTHDAAQHGSILPTLVVLAAVLFNAVLAAVNANVGSLSSAVVIGCEAALTAAAMALGLQSHVHSRITRVWLALVGFVFVIGLANGFGSGGFDPKLVRDVLLIPVFVLLGVSCTRRDVMRMILPLQAIVLVVMIFEAFWPETFGRFFNVMSYYINTRGFQTESFWNTGSDLFVSATRPGDRFLFKGLNIHRLSSVFMEPVSLGNYCVLSAMIAAALWTSLSLGQRFYLSSTTAMMLVGCDGRFATVTILLVVALRVAAPMLPRFVNWFYLPGLLGVAALAVSLYSISREGDDFPSRTAGSIFALSQMELPGLMGYTAYRAYTVMDSGIAYLLYSQSLVGALIIWSFIALGIPQRDRTTVFVAHAVSAYVAMNLMISYSMFSIKTAALLWFSYGAILQPAARGALQRYRGGKAGRVQVRALAA